MHLRATKILTPSFVTTLSSAMCYFSTELLVMKMKMREFRGLLKSTASNHRIETRAHREPTSKKKKMKPTCVKY